MKIRSLAMFTINRSLCEVEFSDIDLKSRDVDIFESVWLKIRENYQNPTDNVCIGFAELIKGVGKYKGKKDDLIESVKSLDGVAIITNQKSTDPSRRFKFNFTLFPNKEGFRVSFDEKLFRLFDEPRMYNEYQQGYVYKLGTKYSKLLYKFLIGYKLLKKKSIYVYGDQLMAIMNVHSDKPVSKIQYDVFKKSVNEINVRSDLNISLEKECVEYKDDKKIVKYKVTINSYKSGGDMNGGELRRVKAKRRTDTEKRIDVWIEDVKGEIGDVDKETKKIPVVRIKHKISHLPIYIDSEYRLRDAFDVYAHTPHKTLDKLNEWIDSDELDFDVWMNDGYSKDFEKVCLLSSDELKARGHI